MIRLATAADIPRIFEIRHSVRENVLSDPRRVTETDVRWFVENGALFVWQEADGTVAGFGAGDPRDGSIFALFVAPGHEGKGIGRALLRQACETVRAAGHREAWLTTEEGTRAERHYRADGWTADGCGAEGEIVFRKGLSPDLVPRKS